MHGLIHFFVFVVLTGTMIWELSEFNNMVDEKNRKTFKPPLIRMKSSAHRIWQSTASEGVLFAQ